jgi:2-haloacid dehalogenase
MLVLGPPPKVITFDCYGTLVRWHDAVRQGVRTILGARLQLNASDSQITLIADRLRAIAGERQEQPSFERYTDVLRASLNQALAEAGYVAPRSLRRFGRR